MLKKPGLLPIGAGEGAAGGAAAAGGGGASSSLAVLASVLAILVAVGTVIGLSIPVAIMSNDLSQLRTELNTTGTQLRAVEQLVLEVAETGSVNITYELIETGACFMRKGCDDDLPDGEVIYTSPLNIYLAYTGPVVSVVAEIAPFDSIATKKRDALPKRDAKPVAAKKHHGRAPTPGEQRRISCDFDNDVNYVQFVGVNPTPGPYLRFPSAAQLAHFYFNDTGPSGGVLETYANPDITRQNYLLDLDGFSGVAFVFNFYPAPDFCAGLDTFDFRSPTKFTLVSGTTGSSGLAKRALAAMRARVHKGSTK